MAKPNNNPTGINQYTKGRGQKKVFPRQRTYTGGAGLKAGTRQQLAVARLNKQLSPTQRHEMAKVALDIRAFTRGKPQKFGSVKVIKSK